MKMKHLAIVAVLFSASAMATTPDYQAQIDQLRADLNTTYSYVNTKYTEAWGVEDHNNIADLKANKVDKTTFQADQARQDKALSDAISKQEKTDASQTASLKSYADQKATSAYTTSVAHTDAKVARADADRKAGDDALSTRIDNNASAQADRDAGQDEHINAVQGAAQTANDRASNLEVRADNAEGAIRETNAQVAVTDQRSINNATRLDGVETVNTTQDKRLDANQSDIAALYGVTSDTSQRLEISNRNIAANKAALESTNKLVSAHSAQLADHEQRITTLEQQTSQRMGYFEKRLDETDRHIDAGLSGVAAMANIPQVTEYQTFAVGAGIGARGDQSAVAVGFSARATQNVVLKVSVAGDSQQKWTVGGGLSYGW